MTLRLPTRALAPAIALAVLGGIVASFMVYRTLPSGAELVYRHPAPEEGARLPARKPVTKPKAKAPVKAKPKAKSRARRQAEGEAGRGARGARPQAGRGAEG